MTQTTGALIALSIGMAFTSCGDNPKEDPCSELECCEGKECNEGDCFEGACMVCCDGRETFGFVSGTIMQLPYDGTPAQVDYAVVGMIDLLVNENPSILYEGTTDTSGAYQTACFDMSNIAMAMLILSDDAGFDGTGGIWYPTYSAVMDLARWDDRTCEPDAPTAFALPVNLVDQLAQVLPPEEVAKYGFAIVIITDADLAPVSGAVLKNWYRGGCSTGNSSGAEDLPEAIYPNADYTTFDGIETSTTGVVLLPPSAFYFGIRYVTAEKDGLTWDERIVGPRYDSCFTRLLIANK